MQKEAPLGFHFNIRVLFIHMEFNKLKCNLYQQQFFFTQASKEFCELITSFIVHTPRKLMSFELMNSFFFHHLQHCTIFGNRPCDRVGQKGVLQN